MVGHCHKRGDTRTFRIDRIAAMDTTEEVFDIPDDFDLEVYRRERLYVPSADAVSVRVRLDPLATTRVASNWPHGEVTRHQDGSSEVAIDCEGFEWVTGWVLGFGKHAEILSPDEARKAMSQRVTGTIRALDPDSAAGPVDTGLEAEKATWIQAAYGAMPALESADADADADSDADADADADSDAADDDGAQADKPEYESIVPYQPGYGFEFGFEAAAGATPNTDSVAPVGVADDADAGADSDAGPDSDSGPDSESKSEPESAARSRANAQ